MLDGNSPDVGLSSLGRRNGETLPIVEKPIAPEVDNPPEIDDSMEHATPIIKNPTDDSAAVELLKTLGLSGKEPVRPIHEEKIKPIKPPEKTATSTNQSRGFLMPFVNWINGVGNTVWKIATSWIPMKQTGTGTA